MLQKTLYAANNGSPNEVSAFQAVVSMRAEYYRARGGFSPDHSAVERCVRAERHDANSEVYKALPVFSLTILNFEN